ncbi:MAG: ABC transporter substrate-binding protein [Chloroflexi bacterium]|nr:ABC transporter substrate-binding protein [Chloroflexota bacterium]
MRISIVARSPRYSAARRIVGPLASLLLLGGVACQPAPAPPSPAATARPAEAAKPTAAAQPAAPPAAQPAASPVAQPATSPAAQPAAKPAGAGVSIKLGVVGPLTGDFAFGGQSQVNGARLAAEEVNARGGVKVEILAEDDAAKCDQSVSVTNKLINQDNVLAILGAWNSTCSLAMLPVTTRAGVPQFTVGIAPAITQQGSPWVFRTGTPVPQLMGELVNYAVKDKGLKRIAILTGNDETAKAEATAVEASLKQLGLQPVAQEEWNRGDKDFSGQINRIRSQNPDALFMGSSFQEEALVANQLKQLGLKWQILGDTIPGNPKYLELGGDAVEGTIFAVSFIPTDPNPVVADFAKRYQSKYNQVADPWSSQLYDTVNLIASVAAQVPDLDRTKLRDAVKGQKQGGGYKGVLGELTFTETGDPAWPVKIVTIANKVYQILR